MTIRKKVLVADASETIIAVCRKLLTQHGFDVTLFQDGTKALEELKRADYDLAVIATATQTVSGYFIVAELKKDRVKAQIPILMLLGSSELLDTKELVQVAPDETLSKPFSPQELLFKIDKLIKLGAAGESESNEPDNDIESILNDDENSFERKISSATDKIFLSMLKQNTNDAPEQKRERPQLDKLDLTEDQYDVEASRPEARYEDTPHDYDWFIREMGGEEPRRLEPKPFVPPGTTGKFQVEEIGSTKISLDQLKKMQQAEEDSKTKVYIEKLNAPLEPDTDLLGPAQDDTGKLNVRAQFLKFFAEALAKEIVKSVDFGKIIDRLDEMTNVKQEK